MCRGRNGNTDPENPIASTNITEYTVLVMNSVETRSMLATTRRPSATTLGSRSKRPSTSTSWATDFVAGVAVFIAIPMFGPLEGRDVVDAVAGHRHRVPGALQRVDEVALLFRTHATEHDRLLDDPRRRSRLDVAQVDVPVAALDPEPLGHRRHRLRRVAGDDLHLHVLVGEVLA